jgi:antitoxin YefM
VSHSGHGRTWCGHSPRLVRVADSKAIPERQNQRNTSIGDLTPGQRVRSLRVADIALNKAVRVPAPATHRQLVHPVFGVPGAQDEARAFHEASLARGRDDETVSARRWGCGTIVAMDTASLRSVRDRLSEFVERVQREHARVTITRNGTPAAVLISPEDLDALEETLEILGDREAVQELREAERAVAAGDVVRGADRVRKLRGG